MALPPGGQAGDNGVMRGSLEPHRPTRSTLDKLDDALLVGVVVVVAIVALQLVGWVLGTVFFLVKVAAVALVAGLVIAWVNRRN
jgi:hypothetical protein